jgi:two-component system chemotaxis sensor kinase CheA
MIFQSAMDLTDIINDLLDIGKIEAGKLAIEPEDVDLRKIVTYLNKVFQPLADTKWLEFECRVEENVPETFLTDPKRLQQILKNLLGNALKFTFEGKVTLSVQKSTMPRSQGKESKQEEAVVFHVEDTGVGISEEQQTKIWEAFEQADGSTTRIYGGTGLGLTISKELTRLLGGKTRLQSQAGKGSTFSLFLPIPKSNVLRSTRTPFLTEVRNAETSGAYLTAKTDAAPTVSLKGRHVLLVDDIERNLKFTSEFLEDEGMKVSTARNGVEAIDLIEKFPDHYDIVLMDMMMPLMDGFEATSLIRQTQPPEKLPIIALTAMVMQEDQRRCLEAHSETLIRTIQKSLSPPI